MRTIALLAFILGVTSAPALSAAISGIGAQPCSKFTSDIAAPGEGVQVEARFYAWAQGWMSRLNVDREMTGASYIPSGQIKGPGLDVGAEQKAFLRNYCASNPANLYAQGATALYVAIMNAIGVGT